MNNKLIFLLTLTMCNFQFLLAQINDENPLIGVKTLISENEISMLWGEGDSGISAIESIYEIDNNGINLEHLTGQSGITGNGHLSIATGDFNGDGNETFIAAWEIENENNEPVLHYYFPTDMNGSSLSWNNVNEWGVANLYAEEGAGKTFRQMKLVTGDFDGDLKDEFVMSFHNGLGKLRLLYFDIDETMTANYIMDFMEDDLPNDNKIYASQFDVAVGDFNWDGREDLAVVAATAHTNGNLSGAKLSILTIDNNENPVFNRRLVHIFPYPGFSFNSINMGVAAGDFSNDHLGHEIAVAFRWHRTNDDSGDDTFLYLFRVVPDNTEAENPIDFHELIFDENTNSYSQSFTGDPIYALDLEAGDIYLEVDNRYEDELVLGIAGQGQIFEMDNNLTPSRNGGVSWHVNSTDILHDGLYSNDFLQVKNVMNDFRSEIVVLKNRVWNEDPCCFNDEQAFDFKIFGFDENEDFGLLTELIETEHDLNATNFRRYALALGDFNGDRVCLGEPTIYQKTALVNPLVVLNPPPTHFDILDGTIYDVSRRYCAETGCTPPGSAAGDGAYHFTAIYEEVTTQANGFSTEFHTNWANTISAEASLSGYGMSLGASYSSTYGEGFSELNQQNNQMILTETNPATLDDDLAGYYIDYKVYEYPLLQGGNTVGYSMVFKPGFIDQQPQTGNVKSTFWETYQPKHEFGNLFSYPTSIDDIENMGQQVKLHPGSDIVNFQSGGGDGFELVIFEETLSEEQQSYTTSTEVSASAGGGFGGFGIEVSVEGEYNSEDVKTRTSSLGEEVALKAYYGSLNSDIAGAEYRIKPVIYWAKDGSLVLDYIVTLSGSFWTTHYAGKCDPAFLLPWRYEEEKGFALPELAYTQKTRDIWFSPSQPQAGEEVTIFARLYNYSFENTPSTVDVHFYKNDPENGGTFLRETMTEFILQGRNAGLEAQVVQINWTVPMDIDPQTRIYAVIDPNENINNEVHEDNNTGWNCLLNPNCSGIALATEWLAFDAFLDKSNRVQLNWKISQTNEIEAFHIEHSKDGLHFKTIGKVAANANTNLYQFTDFKATTGNNYYRIKHQNQEGAYSLSPIRLVKVETRQVHIFPNPTDGKVNIALDKSWGENIQLSVINVLGQEVFYKEIEKIEHEGNISFDVNEWETGIYRLLVFDGEKTLVESFVKE